MNDEQIIDLLNQLLTQCRNTQKFYQEFATGASPQDSFEWKTILLDCVEQRRVFSIELTNLVVSLGGVPRTPAPLHQTPLSSHLLSSQLRLEMCMNKEDETRQAYENALSQYLSRIKRSTLKRQYRALLTTQAQFHRLINKSLAYH